MFTTFSTRRFATLLLTITAACCGMSAAEPAFAAKPFKSQFQRRVVGDISHPANAAAAAPRQANSPSAGADGRIAGLLDDLRKQGLDTAGLERFLNGQLRQIDRLEQPQALPDGLDGWLVAIGAKDPPTGDPAALARWREGLKQKTKDFWARKLATGNHEEIIQGIKQWGGALGKFDQADQDAAAAAIESIKAHQELTENVAGAVPLLGEAIDVLAIARGESLSGEKTTAISVLLTAAANLGPIGLDKFLKRGGKQSDEVLENLGKFAEDASKLDRNTRTQVAKQLGLDSVDKLDEALDSIRSGGFCFLAGTLVATTSGYRPIEEILVGDLVLSRDDFSGEQGYRPVRQLFRGQTSQVCRITVARPRQFGRNERPSVDGGSSGEDNAEPPPDAVQHIRCTPGHEFFRISRHDWTDAATLEPGDLLLGDSGEAVQVVSVVVTDETASTYNFSVESWHTYFVAGNADAPAVWVHNHSCAASVPPGGKPKAIKNGQLAGKNHPVTGVPFDKDGFPIFPSNGNAKLPPELIGPHVSDTKQFQAATRQLWEQIKDSPAKQRLFSPQQLEQIKSGKAYIDGYTWHHHQDGVTMQLVDRVIHNKTGHSGGRQTTGGRS